MKTFATKRRKLFALLLFLTPSYAASDVVVTRRVEADEFVFASRVGADRACPNQLARPKTGDEVTLSVSPEVARRDEPGLSVIVNVKDRKAYILHHSTGTYSELSYPGPSKQLESSFRASMGAAAEELFPFRAEGGARIANATIKDLEVSRHTLAVSSTILRRRDVVLDVLPDAPLGRPAFEVEALSQAIRTAGEEWMSLLGSPNGIPLSISESIHQPSLPVEYNEVFSDLETQDFDPTFFAPPAGYARVDHVPDCFYTPY